MSILNDILGRLQPTELVDMIEKNSDFWHYIKSQPDFMSLKLQYIIFKPFIKLERHSSEKTLEFLRKNRPDLYGLVYNNQKGRLWLMHQSMRVVQELKKL